MASALLPKFCILSESLSGEFEQLQTYKILKKQIVKSKIFIENANSTFVCPSPTFAFLI